MSDEDIRWEVYVGSAEFGRYRDDEESAALRNRARVAPARPGGGPVPA